MSVAGAVVAVVVSLASIVALTLWLAYCERVRQPHEAQARVIVYPPELKIVHTDEVEIIDN